MFKLKKILRNRVKAAIKYGATKKYASTMELLGCSVQEVRKHIESLWQPGMSWDNHGLKGWHIDHIKPCASFDLTDPKQQKECFHWTNLQPLWWHENLKKSSR
jgi:biotin operon repressor